MDYMEFLHLDPSDEMNAKEIALYSIELLEEIGKRDFDGEYLHRLPGVMDKFIDMANSLFPNDYDDFRGAVEQFVSSCVKNENQSSALVRRSGSLANFVKLHSLLVKTYNIIVKHVLNEQKFSEFLLLYNPHFSDKSKAIQLIEEACQLVASDNYLSKRQKKQIIDALTRALHNLQSDSPDWTTYFGTMQQAIIILGALGSLVGGVTGLVALKQANEKISEANNIVIETSIHNISFTLPSVISAPHYVTSVHSATVSRPALPPGKD